MLAKICDAGNLTERNGDHVTLLDATIDGNAERAAALIRDHIDLNRSGISDDGG